MERINKVGQRMKKMTAAKVADDKQRARTQDVCLHSVSTDNYP